MDFEESAALAAALPETLGPLVADIDGTLTNDDRAVDPRVFPVLRAWPAPVVVATGKAMPYPFALAEFLGVEPFVIAENGGVVLIERSGTLQFEGDREAAQAVVTEFQERGHNLGWGDPDLVNRWRETEIAVSREQPLDVLEAIAEEHGLVVVDTGYAYHVKTPEQNKGRGVELIADELDRDPESFVAVGDSVNDAPTFDVVGHSVAVANADETALAAADHVTDAAFGDGFLEGVAWLCEQAE
jgi:phosphoglycolate phosphatase (TIGR01487 family)